MRLTVALMKPLLHRAIFALVLLAFLLPMPGRMPADEVRAAYAAQGLMCAPGSPSDSHSEAHCVLCLLPASGDASEATTCPAPVFATRVSNEPSYRNPVAVVSVAAHQARAPPPSIV